MAAEWYCRIGGAELGPLSSQQLRALAAGGRLRADDEVCQGRDGKWVPASRVKGLLNDSDSGTMPDRSREKDASPSSRKAAGSHSKRAAETSLPKAKAAPTPPKRPSATLPVARVAGKKSGASDEGEPSPFAIEDPAFSHGKSPATRSVSLSPAELAKRRKTQRMKLLIGSVGALGIAVVLGVVLWFIDPFSAPSVATTTPRSNATEEPIEEIGAGELSDDAEAFLKAGDNWLDASKETATSGPVSVRVASVRIDKPRVLRGTGRAARPPDAYLIVSVELTNSDPAKKVTLSGWSGRAPVPQRGTLVDNHGNVYEAKSFTGGTIEGQQRNTRLDAGVPVSDVLVFERPVEAAQYLRLSLPAATIGQEGILRFQIPRRMIGAEPAEQDAVPEATTPDKQPDLDAADDDPAPPNDSEEAAQGAAGLETDETDRPLDSHEKLKQEMPGLFPDQE